MWASSQARPYRGPFSAAAPCAPDWGRPGLPSPVSGRGARRKPRLLRRRIGPAVCAVTTGHAVRSMYRVRCCLLTVSPDNHTAGVCTDEMHSYWSLGVHQGPSPSLLPPHMRTHAIPTITASLEHLRGCRAPHTRLDNRNKRGCRWCRHRWSQRSLMSRPTHCGVAETTW
jgi:hypothetical protein